MVEYLSRQQASASLKSQLIFLKKALHIGKQRCRYLLPFKTTGTLSYKNSPCNCSCPVWRHDVAVSSQADYESFEVSLWVIDQIPHVNIRLFILSSFSLIIFFLLFPPFHFFLPFSLFFLFYQKWNKMFNKEPHIASFDFYESISWIVRFPFRKLGHP